MGWLTNLLDWLLGEIPMPAPAPAPAPVPPGTTVGLVAALNNARAAYRLAALVEDPKLDQLAGNWARTQAAAGVLEHGAFAQRIAAVFPNRAAGEDIAEGQPDVASVVAAWMNSPPHRANILGNYTRVGAGSARSASTLYWVVDFVR